MYFINKHLLGFGALAAALMLTASQAGAQQATFTLPFEAQFGKATLQPGTYKLLLPVTVTGPREIYIEGNGRVRAMLPIGVGAWDLGEHSRIEFVKTGDTYVAEKYTSGATGMAYEFSIPKAVRRDILAKARAASIPITAAVSN